MTKTQKRSVADDLRAARASIQKWWVKGSFVDSVPIKPEGLDEARANGDEIYRVDQEWGPVYYAVRGTCAIGAVAYAEKLFNDRGWFRYPSNNDPLVRLLAAALPKNVHRRMGIDKKDWDAMESSEKVIDFNDDPRTTKRMVLNLFTRAIKLAEAE